MAVTLNLKQGIDLPVFQWLRFQPQNSAAGSCQCNDIRGTDRYIYTLLDATHFYRYDTITDTFQQLASPTGSMTFAAGTDLVYDPSKGRVWLFIPYTSAPRANFQYYDIATDTWTARAVPTGLAAQWATDAALVHTCSTYNAAGNDDYIYLIGNNLTTWYRYSIVGDAWTAMATNLTAAPGAGCEIIWPYHWNTDKLLIIRGGATATIYSYTISVPAIATITYNPATETFTTGATAAYDPARDHVVIQQSGTHRNLSLDLATNTMTPAGTWPYSAGTAIVGRGINYVKTPDGAEYLYYRRQTGSEFFRMLIGWF